jgi:DNA-binding transcriptional LysR family regulator
MDRDLLAHLPLVESVARHRSFAAAAAELGLKPSAVSHAVRMVEDKLGVPLFARTTRSVALTEAGTQFLARMAPALREIQEAADALAASRGDVAGVLRINAPRLAQPLALRDVMAELAARHPQLVVETTSDEALIDIVAAGYDAGVRLGEMIAEDMVAVRLTAPFQAITVASPEYLAAFGTPRTPNELRQHQCIGYRMLSRGGVYDWELMEDGQVVSIKVTGPCRVSDAMFAVDLALKGVGIAYVFEPLVRQQIAEGQLQWLLREHALDEPGLFIYFPRRSLQTPKIRALFEVVRSRV